MKIAKFKLERGIYFGDQWFTGNAWVLTGFFTSDVGSSVESFVKFIQNIDEDGTSSNYCFLEKEDDDVIIGCQFDEDPYENGIRMSQKEFLSMLNQWRELVKQKPQEIIVYKEGESYRLEGHGFPDKQE